MARTRKKRRRKAFCPSRVMCDYCGLQAELCDDREVYSGKTYGKKVYLCRPCGSYVGCHKNTVVPLGRMANKELRQWKMKAHAVFDPLWMAKSKQPGMDRHKARGKAYKWLAGQMGLDSKDCHIGMFDVDQCRKAFFVCLPYAKKLNTDNLK